MAVISGDEFSAVPVGMAQEVVGAPVALKVAVDDVQTTGRDGDGEGRPVQAPGQLAVEVLRGVVVRTEQEFLGLLTVHAGVEVSQPEQGLVEKLGKVSERAALVARDLVRMHVCAVHHGLIMPVTHVITGDGRPRETQSPWFGASPRLILLLLRDMPQPTSPVADSPVRGIWSTL